MKKSGERAAPADNLRKGPRSDDTTSGKKLADPVLAVAKARRDTEGCFGLRPVAFAFALPVVFVLSDSDKTAATLFTSATVCFAALKVRPRSPGVKSLRLMPRSESVGPEVTSADFGVVLREFNQFITSRTVSKRSFRWVIGIQFVAALFAGYALSSIPELRTYKLLNLAGLFYALLGVLVLSEMIATDRWKDFCVRKLAPSVLWSHTTIPVGAICGSVIAAIMHKPSSLAVGLFSFAFWGWSLQVLMAFRKDRGIPAVSLVSFCEKRR